jgi:hypothetical protein
MDRNKISLRRITNLTTLTDDQLLLRAVEYMNYLRRRIPHISWSNTVLMDKIKRKTKKETENI